MSETGANMDTKERIYDEVTDQLRHTVDTNTLLASRIEQVITQPAEKPSAKEGYSEAAPATLSCAMRDEAERLSSTNERLEFILENLERCFGALKAY